MDEPRNSENPMDIIANAGVNITAVYNDKLQEVFAHAKTK